MTKHAQSDRSVARCQCRKCAAARKFLSAIGMPALADTDSVLTGYRQRMWPEDATAAYRDSVRNG